MRTYVWDGAIKTGARPFWGRGVFVFGDLKYQHWLPEITYPTFNQTTKEKSLAAFDNHFCNFNKKKYIINLHSEEYAGFLNI